MNADKITIVRLQQMKERGEKCAGLVVWDFPLARLAERAGADFVVVGDSVGVNLWGHASPLEITVDEILLCCKAVRRAVSRPLLICDLPYGPLQQGVDTALAAAIRLVKEGGAEMIKLDGAADFPATVTELVRAGIPVMPQFGLTPQTALQLGIPYSRQAEPSARLPAAAADRLVEQAVTLQEAGAAMLDFTNSGPEAGQAVVAAVDIPVIGGFGGGPWLDGRVRLAHTAIGYGEKWLDTEVETYATTARTSLQAFTRLIEDVREGRQIKG